MNRRGWMKVVLIGAALVMAAGTVRAQDATPEDKEKAIIAEAEDFIRGMIIENVMKAPAGPGRDTAKVDAGVLAMVPDRSKKVQAPEPLKPTNRFGSPEGSVKHFVESRAVTEDFLK